MLMSTSVGLYSSIHSPSSLSLPLGLSSTSFTKMLSPAVTDDVSSASLATVELLRSSIVSKERGDSVSPPPDDDGCCCSACSLCSTSALPLRSPCSLCSTSAPPDDNGCCCSACSPTPSVALPTKSIMSLTVVILGNVFWPTAEGMPLIIGSSNNAKTVSSFIDIIYSLI